MPDKPPLVCIVDDDRDIRTSLSRALTKRGYIVTTCDSALSFLQLYDQSRPGCVILDYGMPGMTGLELQEEINRHGYPLSVIFITGHGGIPESVQAVRNGAVDSLEKPFRQSDLVACIETAWRMAAEKWLQTVQHRALWVRFELLTQREREIAAAMIEHPARTSSK